MDTSSNSPNYAWVFNLEGGGPKTYAICKILYMFVKLFPKFDIQYYQIHEKLFKLVEFIFFKSLAV